MFHGKMKAVTFSYDDGVTQDQRLIRILDRYGLKSTFNLNSGLLGKAGALIRSDVTVAHVKPRPCEVEKIYRGHEVAAHTLTHPLLPSLSDEEVIRQVEEDRLALSELVGYEVVGMAYPGGGTNYSEHVADLIRKHTGIRYARTIVSSESFDEQPDLYVFRPTVYHCCGWEKMYDFARRFTGMTPDRPQLLYIWGHAYEFDIDDSWDRFETFCQLISGRSDIFYGTNREVLLGE
ncbi:MAG: polysaccharide deacetylase family protein [Eubacteriales bacterium]